MGRNIEVITRSFGRLGIGGRVYATIFLRQVGRGVGKTKGGAYREVAIWDDPEPSRRRVGLEARPHPPPRGVLACWTWERWRRESNDDRHGIRSWPQQDKRSASSDRHDSGVRETTVGSS